jgi:hypothetical protein
MTDATILQFPDAASRRDDTTGTPSAESRPAFLGDGAACKTLPFAGGKRDEYGWPATFWNDVPPTDN